MPVLVMGSQFPDDPHMCERVNDSLAEWAGQRMPTPIHCKDFGAQRSIGISQNNDMLAVVVYNRFERMRHGNTLQMSIASISPAWCRRGVLRALFHYPFVQQDCSSVWAATGRKNTNARRFLERLGFTLRGSRRKGYDGRQDAMLYDMTRDECRWLR